MTSIAEAVRNASLRERVYQDILSRIGYYSFITSYTPSIRCPACGAGMKVEEKDNGDEGPLELDDYSKMARAVVLHLHGLTRDEIKSHYMVLAMMSNQDGEGA